MEKSRLDASLTQPQDVSNPTTETTPSSSHSSPDNGSETAIQPVRQTSLKTRDFGIIPIPRRLRHDPQKPFKFGLLLNIAFGFASTFVVANLYYCQPILIELAKSFNVDYNAVSRIPTLVQAGYATGLLLISPLGDLVRRRQLILSLTILSTSLTIGLAVTNNLVAFETISFLVGAVTVTPQILIPLAADLSPSRRASAISIVLAGLLFGILIARVLSGIIAQYTTWRVVYYFSIGVQTVVLVGSYLLLPDYPSKNEDLTYLKILWTMGKFALTEPTLIQASLINMLSAACFSNFWVTLTFLLGGPPYFYSPLYIGLFGIIGISGVTAAPFIGRQVDKLVPWYASLIAIISLLVFQCVQLIGGGIHVAAVIIATLGLDLFRQTLQVSLTTQVFDVASETRARMNAVLILAIFIGQVMGTAVGSLVFLRDGWRAGAGLSVGWTGLLLILLLLRGPHCRRKTWFGFEGGLRWHKDPPLPQASDWAEKGASTNAMGASGAVEAVKR